MAITFSVPDSVLATTLQNYRKTLIDNIFKTVPLLEKLYRDSNVRYESGGESIIVPLIYGKNTTIAGYSKYGIIDTTPQEGITAAKNLAFAL